MRYYLLAGVVVSVPVFGQGLPGDPFTREVEKRVEDHVPGVKLPTSQKDLSAAAKEVVSVLKSDPLRKEFERQLPKVGTVVEKWDKDTMYRVGKYSEVLKEESGKVATRIDKATRDSYRTSYNNGKGFISLGERGWKKSAGQTKKDFKEITNAFHAVEHYTQAQTKADQKYVRRQVDNFRRGAPAGELWQTGVDHLHDTDNSLAKATQESALLSSVAQAAATFYGGPAGAAAYAAWATYHATGDANLAFRAGIVAAASNYAGGSVSKMPVNNMTQVVQKAALAGAAGGIAVAAAGGDEKAVKDAFLKSAGSVLIQVGTSKAEAYSPTAKNVVNTVQCVSARDVDCVSNTQWAKDAQGKLLSDAEGNPYYEKAQKVQHEVAQWTAYAKDSAEAKKAEFYAKMSKIPGTDAIPLLNNRWVLTSTLGKNSTLKEGVPTVALTYVGPKAPIYSRTTYKFANGKSLVLGSAPVASGSGGGTKGTALHYMCTAPRSVRTIDVTPTNPGCSAIYLKEGGVTQTLWVTPRDDRMPVCKAKAAELLTTLSMAGFRCTAR